MNDTNNTQDTPRKTRKRGPGRPLQVLVRLLDESGQPVTTVKSAVIVDQSRDGRFSFHQDYSSLVVLTLERKDEVRS